MQAEWKNGDYSTSSKSPHATLDGLAGIIRHGQNITSSRASNISASTRSDIYDVQWNMALLMPTVKMVDDYDDDDDKTDTKHGTKSSSFERIRDVLKYARG